jgi:acetyl esterase/lipase
LLEKYPNDDFYFIGDSAGGGFCLSFAQFLRNVKFKRMPEKLVLLSPWVDISMSNPEIKEFEKKDLLLDPKQLLICSHNFAGGLDLKNPIISPLYGDLNELGKIGIFVGTHEIFLPDCRKLREKVEESNTDIFYKEYDNMQHDWMIFPIKEREILLNDVVEFLME